MQQVLQALENLRGADANVTTYAAWINNCEGYLREVLIDPDLAPGLHTARFQQLFGNDMLFDFKVASAESARWHAALYAEIEHQRHRLQQIQRQLDGLLRLAHRDGTPLVYDTNSLMHYQPPETIRWNELIDGPVRLIVPLVVIDELDRKKFSGTPKMGHRAGAGQRSLHKILGSAAPGNAVEVPNRPEATLEVLTDEPGHRRAAEADDEIIERASLLQQIINSPVSVLTHDLGLQLRATLAGLTWTALPDEYKKPELASDQWARETRLTAYANFNGAVDELYQAAGLQLDTPLIDDLERNARHALAQVEMVGPAKVSGLARRLADAATTYARAVEPQDGNNDSAAIGDALLAFRSQVRAVIELPE